MSCFLTIKSPVLYETFCFGMIRTPNIKLCIYIDTFTTVSMKPCNSVNLRTIRIWTHWFKRSFVRIHFSRFIIILLLFLNLIISIVSTLIRFLLRVPCLTHFLLIFKLFYQMDSNEAPLKSICPNHHCNKNDRITWFHVNCGKSIYVNT
jgi:hypothetical protein